MAAETIADVREIPLAPNVAAWVREYEAGPLSKEEVEQFFEQGWVLKRGLVARELVDGARDALAGLVDEVARKLYDAGKITDLCESAPFESRMVLIEKQFPHASVLLHKYGKLPEGVANLWGSKTLLDCAQQFLGSEIAGHPVWNIRVKTPNQEQATVPWHQDTAYLDPSGHGSLQVTAWIPLVPATSTNGCLEVLDRGHRSGREARHTCCVGGTWYVEIAEGEVEKIGCDQARDLVTCECMPGDVLFINNLIPHRSLPNSSDGIRWSLDLRWQKPDLSNGFYGLKGNVLMRTAADKDYKIDWSTWGAQDRQAMSTDAVLTDESLRERVAEAAAASADTPETVLPKSADDEFNTIIVGPWMRRWELVNHNRHTEALKDADSSTSWHA